MHVSHLWKDWKGHTSFEFLYGIYQGASCISTAKTRDFRPFPDIGTAILGCDTTKLNNDQVTGLLKIIPDKEDIKAIKGYSGDEALLAEAERFFVTLLKVPE